MLPIFHRFKYTITETAVNIKYIVIFERKHIHPRADIDLDIYKFFPPNVFFYAFYVCKTKERRVSSDPIINEYPLIHENRGWRTTVNHSVTTSLRGGTIIIGPWRAKGLIKLVKNTREFFLLYGVITGNSGEGGGNTWIGPKTLLAEFRVKYFYPRFYAKQPPFPFHTRRSKQSHTRGIS